MSKKIYITGCAKTGTTLVRRLFNGFDLKVYNKGEIGLETLLSIDFDVGKRNYSSVLSRRIPPDALRSQIKMIKDNDVKVVHVTRNKEDVLKSTGGYVKESRYDAVKLQERKFRKHITIKIAYEDLVLDPDKVQVELSEKLGIKIIHKWSDFPDWFDDSDEPNGNNWDRSQYSIRRVGQSYKKKNK